MVQVQGQIQFAQLKCCKWRMPKAECGGLGTFSSNSLFPAFKRTDSSLGAQKAQEKPFFCSQINCLNTQKPFKVSG